MPLVLNFVEDYCKGKDFKAFCKYFDLTEQAQTMAKDPLVAAGGLKHILEIAIKNDKALRKKMEKHLKLNSEDDEEKGEAAKKSKKRDEKVKDKSKKKQAKDDSSDDSEPEPKKKEKESKKR